LAAVSTVRSADRPLTIGAVCRLLREEFPDVSISKIRYLEDQGLLSLRRTHGGYRLFTEDDMERLRTILRLQRDEFLPLRVIREELTSPGRAKRDRKRAASAEARRLRPESALVTLDELSDRSGLDPAFVRELAEYGILEAQGGAFAETDVDIAVLCSRLARVGIEPRNLRTVRTSIEREVSLLETLLAPALRSRNPERRQGGLEELETLAGLLLELSQLLFWRSIRGLGGRA
jgi:DNA-binding transcriptional MerR regulator